MTIGFVGSSHSSGSSASATTGTHGITISNGDLVVIYINTNDSGNSISMDSDAGASWEPALFNENVTGATATHAAFWKVANGSEPTAYTATITNTQYGMTLQVFSGGGNGWEIDAAANIERHTSAETHMLITASNGEVVSDDSVSLVMGGKDWRDSSEPYTKADNSYTGVAGDITDQIAACAHRLFTTGATLSFDVRIDVADDDDGRNDNPYGAHISFIESAAAGGGIPIKSRVASQMGALLQL